MGLVAPCSECDLAAGGSALGVEPLRRGPFLVHPKPEPAPVPGWLVVAPARHVEQLDELTPEELLALGPLLGQVAAALRSCTPTAKVYLSVFAEVLAHLHVHVIARPPGLAPELRGARIFQASAEPGPGASAACAAVARAVLTRLR
jgi:diadenosine tetraphosphate (Ap4A) HIT family hydrolase